MKGAVIYKDNFRENPLFSLFISDTSPVFIAAIVIAVIAVVLFIFILHIYNPPIILLSAGVTEMAFFVFTTGKKDNEKRYKIIPRQIKYFLSIKKFNSTMLDKSLSDFRIVGEYVERRKTLIAVYQINPYDITFLNDEAMEQYYQAVKMMYHNIPGRVMFITRKTTSTPKDYYEHFFSLYKTSDNRREKLIAQYQKELTEFISENDFHVVKHYVVLSTPLVSYQEKHLALAVKKLYEMSNRIAGSLAQVNIGMSQLKHEELGEYFKEALRN